MGREIMWQANTGTATVSVANSSLTGSGTIVTVLTGAQNGTLIKSIIIKAQVTTGQGMIRLFVVSGANIRLILEVPVPIVTRSFRDTSFTAIIPVNYYLQSGDILKASTELANAINVIAEGLNFSYYTTYREDTVSYTVNTGDGIVSIANPNLDGTGSLGTILTANGGADQGCMINSIVIKGQQTTSPDMVRLFIQDGGAGTIYLFAEVPVPAVTAGSPNTSFAKQVLLGGSLNLQAGCVLYASTDQGQTYSVIASGMDWQYLP